MENLINKNGFFKFDKNLHSKINSGHYIKSSQHQFFSFLLGKIDQSSKAKRNGGYVHLPYQEVTTLFKTPSQYSKIKRDLAERGIIKLRNTVRSIGRGENSREITMKRMNDLTINFNTSEWIPYERKNGNARLHLIAMGLKARLGSIETIKNPILQDIQEPKTPTNNLQYAILNSTLMREHYIPVFGLRLSEELLSQLPENIFEGKEEIEINKILLNTFKNPKAQNIAIQREIYKKRHKSLFGDFINFEKAYMMNIGGVPVKEAFLSALYTHRSRIGNMDKSFMSVEKIRRLTRSTLLSLNKVIVDPKDIEKQFDYNQSDAQNITHTSPITKAKNVRLLDINETVIRGITIPKGRYPVSTWRFGLSSFKYPEFTSGDKPVQIVNGRLYKTFSSDISDKIVTIAQERQHCLSISDAAKEELTHLDSFDLGYIRAYNPDYQFEPVLNEVKYIEDFIQMHTQNIVNLFDCNLISEDDFEIGLQVLLDEAKALNIPYRDNAQKNMTHLLHYVENAIFTYSQKNIGLSLARFANPFDMHKQATMIIKPHKSAFDVSKAKDYTENRFSKRIRDLLQTNDRTSYVDPFVTYAFKFCDKPTTTEVETDLQYENYLQNTTSDNKPTIEEIFDYMAQDYEQYRQMNTPPS